MSDIRFTFNCHIPELTYGMQNVNGNRGQSLYEALQNYAPEARKFEFTCNGNQIQSINGVSNNQANNMEWNLYRTTGGNASSLGKADLTTIFPEEGDTFKFQYE